MKSMTKKCQKLIETMDNKYLLIILLMSIILLLISPVQAIDDGSYSTSTGSQTGYVQSGSYQTVESYPTIPTLQPTIVVPPFDPQTDTYMRFWWQGSPEQMVMSPLGFLYSFVYVFSQFLGEWFYFIIYGIWLFTLWSRSRGTELVTIGILATGAIWGWLLPVQSFGYLLLILAMCIAAIIFRLFKKR